MSLNEAAAQELLEYREKVDSEELDEMERGELWHETRDKIVELFLDEDWPLSDRIIQKEVQELFSLGYPGEGRETVEEYFEEAIEELRTEEKFVAYIYLPRAVDIPEGTEIGDLKIIEKPTEQERIVEHFDRLLEKDKLYEGRCWAKFEFYSYKRRAYVREELFKNIKKPLSILNIVLGNISPPENLAGGIKREEGSVIWHLEPEREPSGWTAYHEETDKELLQEFSELANKEDLTPLEENILGSIELLTLHSHRYRNEHSFLALIGALEGLLVHRYERPKGSKTAEKAVKLLYKDEDDLEEKIEDYRKIKKWYKKRSDIIHGGHEQVHREEVRALNDAIIRIVRRLMELRENYYSIESQQHQDNSYRGLNDLFLEKRLDSGLED